MTIPLDNGVVRETGFEPIRITQHLVGFVSPVISDLLGPGGPLEQSLVFVSQTLSVQRLQGNLVFKPTVTCSNETEACAGAAGTCVCDSATAVMSSLVCGEVAIPDDHIGTADDQVCNTGSAQCETVGPNGAGLTGTDFVLYVTANQTRKYKLDQCSEIANSTYCNFASVYAIFSVRAM